MTKELKKDTLIPLGLGLAGWDMKTITQRKQTTNMERWRSIYTPTPCVCFECFNDLQTYPQVAAHVNPNSINAVDFLMTLNWLLTYPTMPLMAKTWKMTEKHVIQK